MSVSTRTPTPTKQCEGIWPFCKHAENAFKVKYKCDHCDAPLCDMCSSIAFVCLECQSFCCSECESKGKKGKMMHCTHCV